MKSLLLSGFLVISFTSWSQIVFEPIIAPPPAPQIPIPPFEGVNISSISCADIDGDNDQDVLITGLNNSHQNIVRLYKNDGSGKFNEVPETPFQAVQSSSTAFSDVDGDNDQDLLITGLITSSVGIAELFFNDGSGNFTKVENVPFDGVGYSSIAFSDVDGDGSPDLLITGLNNSAERISKLYTNDGSGHFTELAGVNLEGVENSDVSFADIDGDHDPDLLITGINNANAPIAKLYLNDGSGGLSEVTDTPFTGVQFSSVAFSDIDNDNDPDLLITGEISYHESITQLFKNNGQGEFTEVTDVLFGGVQSGSVAFSDVDGDSDPDLLIVGGNYGGSSWITSKSYFFENDGTGGFTGFSENPFPGVYFGSIEFSRLDGDNDADLILLGYDSVTRQRIAKVYSNEGAGSFIEAGLSPFSGVQNSSVAFSDIDGDHDADVLLTGSTSAAIRISKLYINDGTGGYTEAPDTPFEGVENSSVSFADVDLDNDYDLFISGFTGAENISTLYLNNGSGAFTKVADAPFEGVSLGSVAFSDIDGDEDPDILVTGNTSTGPVANLYINDGIGKYTLATDTPFEAVNRSSIAFSDIDGDSFPDVLITGLSAELLCTATLYRNNGAGQFTEVASTPFKGVQSGSIAFADVDGINGMDVLITGDSTFNKKAAKGSTNNMSILYLNDGTGNFTEFLNTPFTGVKASSVAFADIDSDTYPDVLITGLSSRPFAKLYVNDGSGSFSEVAGMSFEGLESSAIGFADVDGDMDPDALVTGYNGIQTVATAYRNNSAKKIVWSGSSWSETPEASKDAIIQGDLALSHSLKVKSLIIQSGNTLIVGPGTTIIINGDLINQGTLLVEDGGSVLMSDTTVQSGNAMVQKQGWGAQKYNLMGSPVEHSSVSSLGDFVYSYDESQPYGNDRWLPASGSLLPGEGYTSFNTGLASFFGILNNGLVQKNINRTEAGDDGIEGWNLIANPYPSAITYDDFMAVNDSEVNGFIYLWDESGKSGYEYSNGDYLVYDGTTTVGGNGGSFNGYINSCQGFFVQKSADGASTVSFTNAMRAADNNYSLMKMAATDYPYLKIKAESAESQINDLLVKFIEDAEIGQDANDAYHMKGNPDLAFYSKIGTGDFIINALPQQYPSEVQLGMDNVVGTYTFSLAEQKNLDGLQVYLEDLSQNIIINLNETTYTVELTAAENLQRFKLHVSYGEILPVTTSSEESTISAFSAEGTLFINDLETRNKEVKVFDLSGKLASSFNYSAAGKTAFDLSLQPGFYLINIQTADTIVSQKIQISR